jgi:hypothetical protein
VHASSSSKKFLHSKNFDGFCLEFFAGFFAAICIFTFEKEKKKGGFEGLERREYSDEY